MTKISIIMPIYNDEEFLKKSIDSALNQTLKDIEIICIDDGSTDNSLKIIEDYSAKDNRIKILSQENKGSGEARNNGLKIANGDYISFLDSDDIFIDETSLEKMYNYAIEENMEMVSGNIQILNKDGELKNHPLYETKTIPFFSEIKSIPSKEYGIPWYFYKNIFKRNFLNENNIKFPNYKRGQDPVFLVNILTKIDKFGIVPVYFYGYNTFSGGGAGNKINTHEKKIDYIKHFKETFDILEEKSYNKILKIYKKELFRYLKVYNKKGNEDFYDIVQNIFGGIEYFKNDFEEEYILFMISYNSQINSENFHERKTELLELNLKNTEFIPSDLFIIYNNILNSNSFEEYEYKNDIKELERKNKNLEKKNKLILSSRSWKITKPLRKIKK